MTLVAAPFGLLWPISSMQQNHLGLVTCGTMDATTEKISFNGHVYMAGRAAGSKTLSSAGGAISFRTGTVTWAAVGPASTLDIGLQDFNTGTGPAGQPDGTFDVKATLTSPAGLTTASWNTVSMTSGAGKSLTHGDPVSVVFDMTARNGADSVILQCPTGTSWSASSARSGLPNANTFTAAAWGATGANVVPNVVLTFDDGTLAVLSGGVPYSLYALEAFQNSTNPDERGMLFQVPWDCKIDALWCTLGGLVNANCTLALWEAPTTAAAAVSGTSVTVPASMLGGNADMLCMFQLPAEVSLTKNTDYCVAVRATGTATVRTTTTTLGHTNYRVFLPGGTTLAKITRNDGTGNFVAESPAVTMVCTGVRISQLHDGAGGGSAGVIGG